MVNYANYISINLLFQTKCKCWSYLLDHTRIHGRVDMACGLLFAPPWTRGELGLPAQTGWLQDGSFI